IAAWPPNMPTPTGTKRQRGMSGSPSQRGNTVSRKPKKKLGSTWYCITNACSQPGYVAACGTCISPGQRCEDSHAAHQAMASSRLPAPMKNISRCGATASRPGEGPEAGLFMVHMMVHRRAGYVDAGQARDHATWCPVGAASARRDRRCDTACFQSRLKPLL